MTAACFVTALLCALPAPGLRGAERFMPVDEVKAGMHGTGISVFAGETRAEFQVEILGTLPNAVGPRRHLILARLSGQRLADTGVMQGMSGSPVYIDGRLVGAVSYSLGAFSKEPIAGITPIADMIDATNRTSGTPAPVRSVAANLPWPAPPAQFAAALRDAFARITSASAPIELAGLDAPVLAALPNHSQLRPIAVAYTMAGFSGDMAATFTRALGAPLAPKDGQAALAPGAAGAAVAATLAPGDAVGVSLIRGDLTFGATGTVTHVDGGRVYAFGHPFFNLGPTEFPLTRAWVQTLLPSLNVSQKLAAIGDVVGTMRQDRSTAIAGTLGAGPALVPVKITLQSDRAPARTFTFEIVKDQLFTPLLTFASIANTLQAYEREFGVATFLVRGTAQVRGHGAVAIDDVFAGDSPAIGAAASVSGPLSMLLRNERQPVQIDGVELAIQSFEEPRTASIERVWLGATEPRAGETVPVHVVTRSYRGEERTHTIPIRIPAGSSGTLSLIVSDGARLAFSEQREQRPPSTSDSVPQLIRAFNESRRNNRIYVKLTRATSGAIVGGEREPSLPPSVLAVIESAQPGLVVQPLSSAVVGEWDVPSDEAITGQRTLPVVVRPY
ncbi:MAG TPA: SpoIVB peptidase S55 domain-containing protein [Vicinamibacterales bacterium]|nr:SpoIVB peptidase S55 domain-containing protein [Vicinamibacterales bacterium]